MRVRYTRPWLYAGIGLGALVVAQAASAQSTTTAPPATPVQPATADAPATAATPPATPQQPAATDAQATPDGSAAQASPAQADVMGNDIVVTAQFRSQRLQDTPVAITALNAAGLEQRSFNSVLDLGQATPNLEIRSGGSTYGPAPQVFIRGVGQADSSYAFEPGVGLYIDDVYYGSLLGSSFDLLDLDRVEVLRGPQGTLAGKNSIGGAIKLFSKKPDLDSADGYVEAGYGSFDRLDAKAAFNLPIIKGTLALRVSGSAKRQDGYLKELDYACLHPGSGVPTAVKGSGCQLGAEGGSNSQGVRAALRWSPSSRFEANLIGTFTDDDSEIGATKLLDAHLTTNVPAGINQSIFITGPQSYSNYATSATGTFTDPAIYNGQPGAGTHASVTLTPESRSRGRVGSLTLNYDLSSAIKLTSISAYQYINGNFARDVDLTPYGVNTINYIFGHKQFTQEIRANARLGTLFDLTVGGFYYHSNSVFGGIQFNSPGTARENIFAQNDQIANTSKSLFSQVIFHPTSRLNAIAAIRYTDDEKTYKFVRRNPYDMALPAYTAAGAIDGDVGVYRGDHVDYRFDVDYRWSDALMTYAEVSTGYEGGGINPKPYVAEQVVTFAPETMTAYEVGFKSDFFDRALTLNGAAFINRFHGIVFLDKSPTPHSTLNGTPVNAGDATFKGVELEAGFHPTRALTIDASLSYLHFQLTHLGAVAIATGVTLNEQAPNAPEWKLDGGAQYRFAIGSLGSITPRLDVAYQSSQYANLVNTALEKTDGRTVLNARLTYETEDHDWQAALSVTNLTNKFYYNNKLTYPIGATVGMVAPPRQVRISLRRNF